MKQRLHDCDDTSSSALTLYSERVAHRVLKGIEATNITNAHMKREEHGHSQLVPHPKERVSSPNGNMSGEGDS